MPTHDAKPEGFDEVARRRAAEVDEAEERARRGRLAGKAAQLREHDAARRATSVPPPGFG
jgi:hypothetical protein